MARPRVTTGPIRLDGLLTQAFPFAKQMLANHGEFFPYAVGVSQLGEVRMFAADSGTDVLQDLREGLRSERNALRAVALTSDVRIADSDAIRVELEHSEGIAISVLLRYRHGNGSGIEYGALSADPGRAQIWAP